MDVTNEVIRKIRVVYRLSLAELGALLDVSESHMCRIESGERPLTAEMTRKLTDELALTPDKLTRVITLYNDLYGARTARESVRKRISGMSTVFA